MKKQTHGMLRREAVKRDAHLTTPPRLEGKVKNAKMLSPKKKKQP